MNKEHQSGGCHGCKVIRTLLTLVTIDFGEIREGYSCKLRRFSGGKHAHDHGTGLFSDSGAGCTWGKDNMMTSSNLRVI